MPCSFSSRSLYEEVGHFLDQFVPHRSYDTGQESKGGWKSLAIKGQNGIATNTYAHTHYNEAPSYKLTDIAKKCPKTMAMLSRITDIEKCQRIRWMLLAPGAKISVHSDKQKENEEVSWALNIALNMPEGCRFWIDTDEDGEHGRFAQVIPIKGGEAMVLNNAKYHYVENQSRTTRIHLIVHGPIRVPDKILLTLAREQSPLSDRKSLINQLMVKRALQGGSLDTSGFLYSQWLLEGVSSPLLPEDIKIILLADEIEDEKIFHEAIYYITQANLFPEPHRILNYSQLDEELPLLYKQGVRTIVGVGAGTYPHSFTAFIYCVLQTINSMKLQGASAAAHIIDHPNSDCSKGLPYFHEQFFILDLECWNRIGRPRMSSPYSTISTSFPKDYIKGESFHDDYTPKFLCPCFR